MNCGEELARTALHGALRPSVCGMVYAEMEKRRLRGQTPEAIKHLDACSRCHLLTSISVHLTRMYLH